MSIEKVSNNIYNLVQKYKNIIKICFKINYKPKS